jgi:hypothetical protein
MQSPTDDGSNQIQTRDVRTTGARLRLDRVYTTTMSAALIKPTDEQAGECMTSVALFRCAENSQNTVR